MGTLIAPVTRSAAARSSAAPRPALTWRVEAGRPTGWREKLTRCGGGYFHTPSGVQAVAPKGELFFAQLYLGADVIGIATGVRSGCGLSLSPRHYYLPTTPALTLHSGRNQALEALRERLHEAGAADLEMDTHDAWWEPELGDNGELLAVRMEYLVKLDRATDTMRNRLAPDHLRCIRRGEAEGWRLAITGAADTSGASLALSGADGTACCFSAAAWKGDELLAQAKVGVAGRRAYCRRSQASQAGRDAGAATWLQWMIMCQLAWRDVAVYNLGTASPAAASDRSGHDPLRVRLGFAPEMVRSRRIRWTLSPGHSRAHRVMGWLGGQPTG